MPVTWQQIADGIHGLNCDGFVWVYAIVEHDRAALIDTGLVTHGDAIIDALPGIGLKPAQIETIVVTHCHQDHAGSLAMLLDATQAKSVAHAADAPVVRGDAEAGEPVLLETEKAIWEAVAKNAPAAPPARVDVEVTDGDLLDLVLEGRVVHMPGHTPGSIAIHLPQRRAMFFGDAASNFSGPSLGFFNVDRAAAIDSFRRVSEMDFDLACFGHGAPLLSEGSAALRKAAATLG